MDDKHTKEIDLQIKEIKEDIKKLNEQIGEIKISLFGTEIVDGVVDVLKKIKDVLDDLRKYIDNEINNKLIDHVKIRHEEKEQKKLDLNMAKWILIIIALFLTMVSPIGIKILELILGKLL